MQHSLIKCDHLVTFIKGNCKISARRKRAKRFYAMKQTENKNSVMKGAGTLG